MRASPAKRVVVVGGGPGGLEAARVAAERGHRVSLHEAGRRLGGAFVLASAVHRENESFLDHLVRGVDRAGVDLRLGRHLSPADVVALSPDAVIVATGGRVITPKIPGSDAPHVLTGPQLRGWLSGRPERESARSLPAWQRTPVRWLGGAAERWLGPGLIRSASRVWMPIGRRVLIVGADLAALELAEFLAERGRHVGILETGDAIAPEVGMKRRHEHLLRLDRAKVAVNTGVAIDRIVAEGVVLRRDSGSESLALADTVILAGEVEADATLYEALKGHVPELHAVGDCTGLGLVRKAVLEGAEAAVGL